MDPVEAHPPRWRQIDITALRERAGVGEDVSAIATALGRTLSDIGRMSRRLGIKLDQKAETTELFKEPSAEQKSAAREPRSR